MKFIGKIVACVLAVVFFLISFTSIFLYSTIDFQTHSMYTEYVENCIKCSQVLQSELNIFRKEQVKHLEL